MRVVFVVDDNPVDAIMLRRALGKVRPDAIVMVAESGDDAVRRLGEAAFHLVILDWRMPGLNGEETLRHLREERPRTPVVILSGLMTDTDRAVAKAAGAEMVRIKPTSGGYRELAIELCDKFLPLVNISASQAPPVDKPSE